MCRTRAAEKAEMLQQAPPQGRVPAEIRQPMPGQQPTNTDSRRPGSMMMMMMASYKPSGPAAVQPAEFAQPFRCMIALARAYLQGHRARTSPHPVVTGRQRLVHGSAVEIVASASPTRASLRDDSGPAWFGFAGARYIPASSIDRMHEPVLQGAAAAREWDSGTCAEANDRLRAMVPIASSPNTHGLGDLDSITAHGRFLASCSPWLVPDRPVALATAILLQSTRPRFTSSQTVPADFVHLHEKPPFPILLVSSATRIFPAITTRLQPEKPGALYLSAASSLLRRPVQLATTTRKRREHASNRMGPL
ncbi:hypothetical protein TgHK011_003000 [Trichoderma gracile]|nr:hypothetical protein TgHK011_003000 [Trichoderma gracile]